MQFCLHKKKQCGVKEKKNAGGLRGHHRRTPVVCTRTFTSRQERGQKRGQRAPHLPRVLRPAHSVWRTLKCLGRWSSSPTKSTVAKQRGVLCATKRLWNKAEFGFGEDSMRRGMLLAARAQRGAGSDIGISIRFLLM